MLFSLVTLISVISTQGFSCRITTVDESRRKDQVLHHHNDLHGSKGNDYGISKCVPEDVPESQLILAEMRFADWREIACVVSLVIFMVFNLSVGFKDIVIGTHKYLRLIEIFYFNANKANLIMFMV